MKAGLVCALLISVLAGVPTAGTVGPRFKVAILVFDHIQLFDFMGPYDVQMTSISSLKHPSSKLTTQERHP